MKNRKRLAHASVRASALAAGVSFSLIALGDATSIVAEDAGTTVAGNSPVSLDFALQRTGDLGADVYVSYATENGSALAGADYVSTTGLARIAAGESGVTASVLALGSISNPADKTFGLKLLGATAAGPLPGFGAPGVQDYDDNSTAVASADFNGDGKADYVTGNGVGNSLYVVLNTTAVGASAPSYGAQLRLSVGNQAITVATADFNGDGKPDLVSGGQAGVRLLFNGTATGAAAASFSVAGQLSLAATRYVAVGDFNFDGKPDLAVATSGPSAVVLINQTAPGAATASFGSPITISAPASPSQLAVADFNGDGRVDLAASSPFSSSVTIAFNETAPGATSASFSGTQTLTVGGQPWGIVQGDLNTDGKPDLVVVDRVGQRLVPLLNGTTPGATTPSFTVRPALATDHVACTLSIGDLNGDGKPDLLASMNENGVQLLTNVTAPGATTLAFHPAPAPDVGDRPWDTAIGDFNGDGRPDLASVSVDNRTLTVAFNTTAPQATVNMAPAAIFVAGNNTQAPSQADFNGDGKLDLIVPNPNDYNVQPFLNTTAIGADTPSFVASPVIGTGMVYSLAIADFNLDGKPDAAAGNQGAVSFLLNTTAPGADSLSFVVAGSLTTTRQSFRSYAADINGDGKPDLVMTGYATTGGAAVALNQTEPGASTITFGPVVDYTTGRFPQALGVADFNGDGRVDIAVPSANNSNITVLINTTPVGGSTPSFVVGNVFGAFEPSTLVAGDMDGDGLADLVAGSGFNNRITIYRNTTPPGSLTSSFVNAATPAGVSGSAYFSLDDFNGDGLVDIAVSSYYTPQVALLTNTSVAGSGTLSFGYREWSIEQYYPSGLTTGDFNNDGRPDFAITSYYEEGLSVLLNRQYVASATGTATGTIHYEVPVATLSPSSLDFGEQSLNTTSLAQAVTLTNSGGGVLHLGAMVTGAEFSQSTDCPASLAAGASCTISVTFRPITTGPRSGTLSVPTDAPAGGLSTVALAGIGKKLPTTLTAAPGQVNLLALRLTVSARLQTVVPLAPPAGQTISFKTGLGTNICSAVTGADGVASCYGPSPLLSLLFGNSYTATFAGSTQFEPSTGSAAILGL